MSEASILFDFKKATQQAEEIDSIATQLSTLSTKEFESTMQTLSSNWKGTSATAYLEKCTTLQETLNVNVTNMRTVASNIRTVAKKIYDAEMENLRREREREKARAAAAKAAASQN